MFLEKEYDKFEPHEQKKLMEAIKTHSPMSWGHLNFLGEYDFSEEKMRDSCGILPAKIAA